ncbi:phosphoribosylamine--glycine ligase [Candidatus Peregrinibacteria bacterium]|nr:phosphoribosylamine--glycine ligase [Candidatus Peregrinibacteria bacterium]
MKKILLIGNGAREHVMAETLKNSRHGVELFAVGKTKNPGIADLCEEYMLADVCDEDSIREFANRVRPDMAVIGPEAPIAEGITDMLLENGIKSASPLASVGRLETSKSFARDLLTKYKIPGNPKYKVFFNEDGLSDIFDELGDDFVVKADGLKGGKGVKVSGDHLNGKEEGMNYARECLEEAGRVVIEEKLVGQEFSLMCFCDGQSISAMPCVQDHKRAYEGDKGPNTGGMGSYSAPDHLLPFLSNKDVNEAFYINERVLEAIYKETDAHFKGVMYGGFILTKNGVKLIEYNARFGDPEVMNVLPLLKTDFVDVCDAIINDSLDELELEFEHKATVCKYVVPEGYPDNPVKNEQVNVSEEILTNEPGLKLYYASVDERDDGLYLAGSRALAFVGIAETIEEAEAKAQKAVESVKGPVFFRKDIGTRELIDSKIEMMNKIRGV